ncbi:MAG: AAA family ATPase [Limnochordales bacterium]|nr:AAA family ATPase [Limnochordales bacterium]
MGVQPVWKREMVLGAILAAAVVLYIRGLNLLPYIGFAGILALILMINRGILPGTGRRFATVVGGAGAGQRIPAVCFDDIGGQETAKRELMEALEFVKEYEKAAHLGIRPIKGILLAGPPGTGKTLLAKAAANYTDSVFVAASGSEFVEMFAGVGAQRVRQLFAEARRVARECGRNNAIIFLDELEVIGGQRGRHSSHLEYDQTLNQLLVEMDGIRSEDPVRLLVLGATNRADLLDPALLRPGRFDRVVRVELPDREGRRRILEIHTRGKPLAADVDLDELARESYGFSGAHLESLVNEAAIFALRARRREITRADFFEALEKVMMGEKLDRRPTPEERLRVAVHEVGHALISELENPGSVAAVTVTSRGQALGYTRQTPPDDQYLWTRQELLRQIAVTLGGTCAEELVLGERSTGAAGDFEQGSELAKKLVWCGMSSLGIVSRELLSHEQLSAAVQEVLQQVEKEVREKLAPHQEFIREVAELLLEQERISGERFRELLKHRLQARIPA